VSRNAASFKCRKDVYRCSICNSPVEISSSYDSSWQAITVCPRNPHPETYCYLVIAPQGVHKFTNFIARRNGCYHNSFQAISRRRIFGSQLGVIDPIPPHPDPPIWYSNEPSRRDLQLSKYNPFRNTYRKVARGRKLFPGSVDRVRVYHNDHCKILSGRPPFLLGVGVDPLPLSLSEGYIKMHLVSISVYSVLKAGRSPALFVLENRAFWSLMKQKIV